MTANAVPATTTKGLTRLIALLVIVALALGACSSDEAGGEASESTFPEKEAISPGDDGDDEGENESDDNPTVDTTAPDGSTDVDEDADQADQAEDDENGDDRDDDGAPISPPGTINELEDIIDNESDEMIGSRTGGSLVDRFIVAILADSEGLDISEADARCAGETLEEELSTTSFELLVTNLETLNEIEDGNQFTEAELLVISESLAGCLDLRPLVEQAVEGDPDLMGLTDCIARTLDVDAVESLVLFEILGENGERLTSPIILAGLDLSPTEARTVIDNTILDQFLLDDGPAIEACLADVNNEDLRPFFETRPFNELIMLLREQCLF